MDDTKSIVQIYSLIIVIILLIQILSLKILPIETASGASTWTQTSYLEFSNSTLEQLSVTLSGEVKLFRQTKQIEDDFVDDSKIRSLNNIYIDTSKTEAKLIKINNTYGGSNSEAGLSIIQTSDNGYVIAGDTLSYGAGEEDIWLIKTDCCGAMEWNRTFGGAHDDWCNSMCQASDGGYVIVGATQSIIGGETFGWLIKTDKFGNKEWNKTFSGSGSSIALTSDGGYIIGGSKFPNDIKKTDFYLIKIDSYGNIIWSKTIGGIMYDRAQAAQQTSDNGYIITGWTSSYGAGDEDVWLVKTDSNGNELWNRTFGTYKWDQGICVRETPENGLLIAGNTNSYGVGQFDFWLIKTDNLGNEQWNKTFGGINNEQVLSLQVTSDYGYIITGYTNSFSNGNKDIWLIKTDSLGNEQWNRTFGGIENDAGRAIRQTIDGGYIITGSTSSFGNGKSDLWLIKTDNHGVVNKTGILNSIDLINEQSTVFVNTFDYTANIPSGADIKVQFSLDNINWFNSVGFVNDWEALNNGVNSIDLTSLSLYVSNFYYRLNFSSSNNNLPSIQNIIISYSLPYPNYGTLESSPFDIGGNVSWKSLSWSGETPPGTNIKFKLKTAKSKTELPFKSFLGPDGKPTSYYIIPGKEIWSGHSYDNWIQYQLFMSTSDNTKTPILFDVTISFNYLPNKPILYEPKNNSALNFKIPTFKWNFYDQDSNTQIGFQWQAADSVNFSTIAYDSGEVSSSDSSYTLPYPMSDGIWYWRLRVQDSEGDWGPFSDPYILIIDTTIEKPLNITVTPNYWTTINFFNVSWENPNDFAGIAGVYYKLDSLPISNTDGNYIQQDEINAIKGINLNDDGEHIIYLWLIDKIGNVNYLNFSSARLYLDQSSPGPPINISIIPNNWTSTNLFIINWTNPIDSSGIISGAFYYMGSSPPISHADGIWL